MSVYFSNVNVGWKGNVTKLVELRYNFETLEIVLNRITDTMIIYSYEQEKNS